jgi:DNA-binding NarL/FixJ family response regulator
LSQPVILLIMDDAKQTAAIARAIEAATMHRPLHVAKGESAVLWAGANDCDVCVVDYDLPGISGLETLVRIHQRKPNLPVIMLSGAASERVAIDAFHAGVLDYVPKKSGYADAIARLVLDAVKGDSATNITALPTGQVDVPEQLLQPTYQHRLRVIGRQLDLYSYRSIHLLEVAGGFLVRASAAGNRTPEALEFPDRDFRQLAIAAVRARGDGEHARSASRLLPTGYEDYLRMVGARLDAQLAEAVTIAELDGFVAVGGITRVDETGQTTVGPFQWLQRDADISYLLDEAYHRRSQPARRGGLFRSLGGGSASSASQ